VLFLGILAACAALVLLIPWGDLTGPSGIPPEPEEKAAPRAPAPLDSSPESAARSGHAPPVKPTGDLKPGPSIRMLRGTVKTPAGFPISEARVRARLGTGRGGPETETRTDKAGAFALEVPPFKKPGHPHTTTVRLEASASSFYTEVYRVPLLEVTLPPKQVHFILGQPGALSGKVTLAGSGKAVKNVRIAVGGQYSHDFETRTDPDGRYTFPDLKPGQYRIHVYYFGAPSRPGGGSYVEIRAGTENRADFKVRDPRSFRVEGQVTEGLNGKPVAGMEVRVRGLKAYSAATRTDGQGRFSLNNVPEGYHLHFESEGYSRREKSRHMGSTAIHEVVLTRYARLRGRVVDPDQMGVAGAWVFCERSSATDEAGGFDLEVFPRKGRFTLLARAEGYARARLERAFDLTPGKVVDGLMIRLQRGGTLAGRIRDEQGRPLETAFTLMVEAEEKPHRRKSHRGHTVQDGTFSVAGVSPGRYRGCVRVQGYLIQALPGPMAVKEGERLEGLDVIVRKAVILRGRVVNHRGRGLAGAGVHTRLKSNKRPLPAWGFTPRTFTSPDGAFEILLNREENFEVTVQCPGYERETFRVRAEIRPLQPILVRLDPLARVEGQVRYADTGKPVPAFRLDVQPRGEIDFTRSFRDLEGRFVLEEMKEGSYEITARDPGGAVTYEPVCVQIKGAENPPPVVLLLGRTSTFTGVVRASAGTPLHKARVALYAWDDREGQPLFTGGTNPEGRFEILRVHPGTYKARATHPAWIEAVQKVALHCGETVQTDFRLDRGGARIRVFARDGEGRPVEGARITVYRMNGFLLHPDRTKYEKRYLARKKNQPGLTFEAFYHSYTRTNAAGRMERRFLPSGRFEVRAAAEGFTPASAEVEIQAGLETPVVLTLQKKP